MTGFKIVFRVEVEDADAPAECTVRLCASAPYSRSKPADLNWTDSRLTTADRLARCALQADVGTLHRTKADGYLTYRREPPANVVKV